MFDRLLVKEALKNIWMSDRHPGWNRYKPGDGQSSIISLLIHDIFGGEILKTPKKTGWHFYNRIDGLRIDFSKSEMSRLPVIYLFEDILSTPEEAYHYFDQEDYSTFYTKFIRAFETVVGHRKYRLRQGRVTGIR
jgi:hypothetical protein